MWEKIKNFLLFLLITLVIISGLVINGLIKQHQQEVAELQNSLLKKDSLYTVKLKNKDKLYYLTTEEIKKIRIENEELRKLIKEEKEKNIYAGNVIASLQDSLENIQTQQDTLDANKRLFDVWKENIHLVGSFQTKSPFAISFDTIQIKIKLDVNITETQYGKYKTYVSSPYKNIVVEDIKTQFSSNVKQNNFILGTGFGYRSNASFNANLLLGYKHIALFGGYDTNKNWNAGVYYIWF